MTASKARFAQLGKVIRQPIRQHCERVSNQCAVHISKADIGIPAAVAARAELIVTGDRKHLLPIGVHQRIAIVTAREVVDRIEASRTN